MIRLAQSADWQAFVPHGEAGWRLKGWQEAYGDRQPFLRFFTDGIGSLLGCLDTAAVFEPAPAGTDWEEWGLFLAAQPELRSLRSHERAAERLTGFGRLAQTGAVLRAASVLPPRQATGPLTPREMYPLLTAAFGERAPAFEGWYLDVSHRLRHGGCRIVGVRCDGRPVAGAMTVAEAAGGAVIGGVATAPDCRGRGYAGACVAALCTALSAEGKTVLTAPDSAALETWYIQRGFVPDGTYGERIR